MFIKLCQHNFFYLCILFYCVVIYSIDIIINNTQEIIQDMYNLDNYLNDYSVIISM